MVGGRMMEKERESNLQCHYSRSVWFTGFLSLLPREELPASFLSKCRSSSRGWIRCSSFCHIF